MGEYLFLYSRKGATTIGKTLCLYYFNSLQAFDHLLRQVTIRGQSSCVMALTPVSMRMLRGFYSTNVECS